MNRSIDWSEWILQKNSEAKQEELKKSDFVKSKKLEKASGFTQTHVSLLHRGLAAMGHKNHNVSLSKDGGIHVDFDASNQDDNSGDIQKVLKQHGIKHGLVHSNEVEDLGHEHFVHPV